MIIVIEAGCAECHGGDDEPLIIPHTFDTVEDAKDWTTQQGWLNRGRWVDHPNGGEHMVVNQGSVWITPLQVLEGLL